MKERINSALKKHLVRGAFYLLFLLAACVIPFALAQRTTERQNTIESMPQLPTTSIDSGDHTIGSAQVPQFPAAADFPAGKYCGPLYDQYDNPATQPPLGIGSQQFEPAMAAFNDQAADDFVLPQEPKRFFITTVHVMGEYSAGGGPASSFNVFFYTNGAGNLPGTQIAAFLNLPYTGTPPNFDISVGGCCFFSLNPGTYWISVQAVQNFNPNGQWFWHNRTVQSNAGAAWQNPGGGYGTGCKVWNRKNLCLPDQVWPDQVFSLSGCFTPWTPTATPTATWTPTATATATATPTLTPAPTPRSTPVPRARPTPPPRP